MRSTLLHRIFALLFAALVGLSASCAARAATPSFLCSKAKSWVEKTICASGRLSELDLELAVVRSRMLDVLKGDAEKAFTAEHGKWWANLAQCQKDKDPPSCLEGRYEARIKEFTSRADYPGDILQPRQEFSESLIKEAGKGWSQNMSAYMKAIRACIAKPTPKPRALVSVWTEEEGEVVMMHLRGAADVDLICFAKKDGTGASLRKREPVETLPQDGPILWLGAGPPPKEACGKPVQVIDTDDTPVGWVADAKC